MNNRWKGSVALCIFMLALSTHPSVARLDEGNFVPFSQAVSGIADRQTKLYRIEKGDTLSAIARDNDVSLNKLMLTNNMDGRTILKVGATLKIPDYQGPVHIVAPGETINDVAEIYQVSEAAIISANLDQNVNNLEVGDCLRIPETDEEWFDPSPPEPSRGDSQRSTFNWPITGRITCPFGTRKSGFHHGIDIASTIGTPIHAAAAGTVSWAGPMAVYGRTVIIDHPDGKQTLYAHASVIYVKKGDQVDQGQVISAVGITGVTTGPHLHFEIRIDKKAVDPISYLR